MRVADSASMIGDEPDGTPKQSKESAPSFLPSTAAMN